MPRPCRSCLGRHCLLFLERIRPKGAPSEPLVLDGLRTFEHSQYWPFDLNLLVGASHFVYGFSDAELRPRLTTVIPALAPMATSWGQFLRAQEDCTR